MRFIDLFAGLGGFHKALSDLGHQCVYASEIDEDLRLLYTQNFPHMNGSVYGDIRLSDNKNAVPEHDILCAGFPCQPFSKSGSQQGLSDPTRGTLFHEILDVLERHKPEYIILENVGNFERHDQGRTWRVVKEKLELLGYVVKGTEHVATGGSGLLSPHHLGYPHARERFYIVGHLIKELPANLFPKVNRFRKTKITDIVQSPEELTDRDVRETCLTPLQKECIDHWNQLIRRMPDRIDLPSFPIWTDELDAEYPFESNTPFMMTTRTLKRVLRGHPQLKPDMVHEELVQLLPSYARSREPTFPKWKIDFIRQNRQWLTANRGYFKDPWVAKLRSFPSSLRKFEWNCNGEERELWKHVLQFRPSGLRVKRYTSSPALVAMTSTQIPILGPEQRFITRTEGLRLQGFSDGHKLPESRVAAFKCLGNAVHVGVIREIARRLISPSSHES